MLRLFALFLVALVCACTTATLRTAFDPAEAAYVNETGKGVVRGQAFLRRNDGIVVYAAGSEVLLIPATRYARERMHSIYQGRHYVSALGGKTFENDDPRYYGYMRKTVADGEGRFEFAGVAPGGYFLMTSVYWSPDPNSIFPEGGGLMYEAIVTEGGDPVTIIMSGM